VARVPVCHPERRHFGRGYCSTCYHVRWRTGALTLIRELPAPETQRRTQEEGPRLLGVPAACPRCENPCLRHYAGAPEVDCLLCGWEGHLRLAQGVA
jgi:hypothetical protein